MLSAGCRAGSEITIDDLDSGETQRLGSVYQGVLKALALFVVFDLPQGGLTQIGNGYAGKVIGRDLLNGFMKIHLLLLDGVEVLQVWLAPSVR